MCGEIDGSIIEGIHMRATLGRNVRSESSLTAHEALGSAVIFEDDRKQVNIVMEKVGPCTAKSCDCDGYVSNGKGIWICRCGHHQKMHQER
jgi:hypothetical protein